jgi:hypothetical protein
VWIAARVGRIDIDAVAGQVAIGRRDRDGAGRMLKPARIFVIALEFVAHLHDGEETAIEM